VQWRSDVVPVDPHSDEDDRGRPGTPSRLGSDRSLYRIKSKEISVHLKFRQHLPCTVTFPKPATYNGTKADNHIHINGLMAFIELTLLMVWADTVLMDWFLL
jgi:hypothetical protein